MTYLGVSCWIGERNREIKRQRERQREREIDRDRERQRERERERESEGASERLRVLGWVGVRGNHVGSQSAGLTH